MNQPRKSILTKDVKSWIAYDAGNSAFATTVLAAFFPLFFASYWTSGFDDITSTKYFTASLTVINLIIFKVLRIGLYFSIDLCTIFI